MPQTRENPEKVELIRRKDPRTLETVAAENLELLLRGALAAGVDAQDASDLVQETLLVFVRKAPTFDGRASVRTWLYGILLNKISERRRTKAREDRIEPIDSVLEERFNDAGSWIRPPAQPDVYAAGSQAITWLVECMKLLPERRRLAFVMREVEQLDVTEICKILELSANNLGVLLFRARNALRECMEGKGIRGLDDVTL